MYEFMIDERDSSLVELFVSCFINIGMLIVSIKKELYNSKNAENRNTRATCDFSIKRRDFQVFVKNNPYNRHTIVGRKKKKKTDNFTNSFHSHLLFLY